MSIIYLYFIPPFFIIKFVIGNNVFFFLPLKKNRFFFFITFVFDFILNNCVNVLYILSSVCDGWMDRYD